MAIYRGPGGAGDATGDATNASALALAAKDAAEAAAISAASAATAAGNSATAADVSATNAATQASNAAGSATSAATSATNASNSATAASSSATTAATQASNAASSAITAAASATSASTYASTASTQATNAASSASSASASASTATTKASAASTSATNAAASATTASTAATNASNSATAAATSATNASSSASSASTSASSAGTSASTATTQATNASNSASAASTSATNASNSASAASTSATDASISATSAATSATAAAASYDSFDDRYLGVKSAAPTLDNDGNALLNGALYFDSVLAAMRVYSTSTSTWASIQQGVTNTDPVRHSIRPSLLLDFANTKRLDPRITFTRASTAVYYDGVTTAKAEENLLTYSSDLSISPWTSVFSTITGNSATSPDGTTTAATITATATTSYRDIEQLKVSAIAANTPTTVSAYIKAGTYNFATLINECAAATAWVACTVNLSTGVITNTGAGATGTYTSSSITSIGNGWYRVSLTGSTTSVFNKIKIALASSATPTYGNYANDSWTAVGTESILAWGAQLEQRSAVTAYTPTTTQAITNYTPVLKTAVSGEARFDSNPTTGESLGLLIEESRTNLLTRSEEFASWSQINGSTSSNVIVAPDGTLTADKFVANTVNGQHRLEQTLSLTSGTTYTISAYAKAAECSRIELRAANDVADASFDLSTGTVSGVTSGSNATMVSVGNGWYRCSITGTATTTGSAVNARINVFSPAGATTWSGNDWNGLFIWGAQLEAGSFATSYIPTVASQVTRAADAAVMTGAHFSSWYNLGEGGFLAAYSRNSDKAAGNQIPFMVSDGTGNNIIAISDGANGVSDRVLVVANGATQMNTGSVNYTANQLIIRSIAYKVDDFATSANGAAVVTDTSALVPVVNQLSIGYASYFGASRVNGHIRKLAYYPKRLTNAELQGLTTV